MKLITQQKDQYHLSLCLSFIFFHIFFLSFYYILLFLWFSTSIIGAITLTCSFFRSVIWSLSFVIILCFASLKLSGTLIWQSWIISNLNYIISLNRCLLRLAISPWWLLLLFLLLYHHLILFLNFLSALFHKQINYTALVRRRHWWFLRWSSLHCESWFT